ncbi:MAG: hypothetical protein JWO42_3086 [Chloroflexi bacterium]|jgi:hypothetical protein|nr:hypothetical protein [Chloroflexota bacterium]
MQEWAAVAIVTSPWDGHIVLSTIDNAIRVTAHSEAALPGLSAEQFYLFETDRHASMLAAAQRFLRTKCAMCPIRYDVTDAEIVIDTHGFVGVHVLSPSDEAALIRRIFTTQMATTYLQSTAERSPTAALSPTVVPPQIDPRLLSRLSHTFAPLTTVTGKLKAVEGAPPTDHSGPSSDGKLRGAYEWTVLPPKMGDNSVGDYLITVYSSSAEASYRDSRRSTNASYGCPGVGGGCRDSGKPNLPILARPDGGWIRGGCNQYGCGYTGGKAYKDLQISVDAQCLDSGAKPRLCQAYITQVLHFLVARAKRF